MKEGFYISYFPKKVSNENFDLETSLSIMGCFLDESELSGTQIHSLSAQFHLKTSGYNFSSLFNKVARFHLLTLVGLSTK